MKIKIEAIGRVQWGDEDECNNRWRDEHTIEMKKERERERKKDLGAKQQVEHDINVHIELYMTTTTNAVIRWEETTVKEEDF